jgi:hypothetical protein
MRYDPWIVYNHRAPAHDPPSSPVNVPSARQKRPRRPINRPSRHRSFDLPLQAVAIQRVGHNSLQHISYRMGFYSVKCQTGVEGVRPVYTTATATHKPPQIFFRQLAPSHLRTPVAMLHSPTSAKTSPTVRSGWPSPLRCRKRSGLFSCPTSVAWPTVASAAVV